jgi:TRAP-type mannitol/chloroaromatic compound transport system permease small subunit
MILIAFASLLLQAIAEVIKLIAILRDQEHLVQTVDRDAPIRIE